MVLNLALGGMLVLAVGALLACHHFGWLVDYFLQAPHHRGTTRYSLDRSELDSVEQFVLRDLPTNSPTS